MNTATVDLTTIAKKVVNDCLLVKPGENVWIGSSDPYYYEFAEEVALAAVEAQAYPFITMSSDRLSAKRFDNPIGYFSHPPVFGLPLVEIADVYLQLAFPRDPEYLKNISPDKLAASAISARPLVEAIHKRNATRGNLRMSSFLYPTPEAAKKYGLSFEEYSHLVWSAVDIDYKALSARAKNIADILKNADKIHITTEDGTDLTFSIKGRKILIDDGVMDEEDVEENTHFQNLPTGEVYCAPIEETAEGTAVFQYNIFYGEPLVNLRTTFREGRMTNISADKGFEHFHGIMESNAGEKYRIAELGIGLNPNVTRVTGDLALDEKIIGTIHIAVGENRMFKGKNEASIHHDFVMMSPTVKVDGETLIVKGEYLI